MTVSSIVRCCVLAFCACAPAAVAHVGSPNVFFDGEAGPYPVHIVIRPPGVIPGLAEISVRVLTNGAQRVTVVPIRWNTGRQGAPRPDVAELVRGETNLFNAQLWFMVGGAQSVEVGIAGSAGHGRVVVPVNAVATAVLPMPRGLGTLLAGLGAGLVLLAVSIVGGAVRESVLPPGEAPPRTRIWGARTMTILALTGIAGFLWFGRGWWRAEARDYRSNRLFRPVETAAEMIDRGDSTVLRLRYATDPMGRNGPVVPDHGKLMHLFLVREPGLDVFAHLHPTRVDAQAFDASLPALPAGRYRAYGDITYESGFSDTLSTVVNLPAATRPARGPVDGDDSWRLSAPMGDAPPALTSTAPAAGSAGFTISRAGVEPIRADRDTYLRFDVRDGGGRPAALEPYMGMRGHLILRRDDGSVFTHLHPGGSFSMAAKQLFDMRLEGTAPLKVASFKEEPICKVPLVVAPAGSGPANELSFPYAFPMPGNYRLWVQARVAGEIITGVFDVAVQ